MLTNTCGKLVEKCMAKRLQSLTPLFHELRHVSRVGRSAVDAPMILVSKAETSMKRGDHATLLWKDIVSAFNQQRSEVVCGLIEEHGA